MTTEDADREEVLSGLCIDGPYDNKLLYNAAPRVYVSGPTSPPASLSGVTPKGATGHYDFNEGARRWYWSPSL